MGIFTHIRCTFGKNGLVILMACALIGGGLLAAQLPASHTAERVLQIREGLANGGIWAVICMMGRVQLLNLLTGEREEIPGEANPHTIFAACHGGAGRERTAKEVFSVQSE